MYFFHFENVRFVRVLRTRDRIMRSNTLCIHTCVRDGGKGVGERSPWREPPDHNISATVP